MITLIFLAINTLIFIGQIFEKINYTDYAMVPNLVLNGQFYRFVTCAFLHASIPHFMSNMVSFANLGNYCEANSKKRSYLLAILLSLIGSSTFILLFSRRDVTSLGFSGVVFGILGYFATLLYKNDGMYDENEKYLLARMIIPNIIISLMPGVSWQAHLGGFIGGFLAGILPL